MSSEESDGDAELRELLALRARMAAALQASNERIVSLRTSIGNLETRHLHQARASDDDEEDEEEEPSE